MTLLSDSEADLLVLDPSTGPATLLLPNGRSAHLAPSTHSACSHEQAASFACTFLPEPDCLFDSEGDHEDLLLHLERKYGIMAHQPQHGG